MKGSAVDQYLGNIIKRIKDSNTLIISVDPTDVHRVTRSFNSLVHLGRPSDVFRLAGLIPKMMHQVDTVRPSWIKMERFVGLRVTKP